MEEDEIVIKRGSSEYVLTEKRIRELTSKFIELCNEDASLHNDFGKNTAVVKLLIDIKKAWFPETNKNINLNIESFDENLNIWMKKRKELIEKSNEEVYIIK